MAWNEPGDKKPDDPWGGGNQGPPDLDEALKKFQEKLNGLFGGGGSGKGTGGSAAANSSMFLLLLLILSLGWVYKSTYRIDEQMQPVVLRLGKFHEVGSSGLNFYPWPIDEVVAVNVTLERQYPTRGLMLTQDENIVEFPLTVQYNIADAKAFVLNVRNPILSLENATDSALRHVVGSSTLDDALSDGRAVIALEVKQRLQQYLDSYGTGIQIVNVNLQRAEPPTEVKSAFDDVVKAKEDRERFKNEAQAYANGIIPEARGQAQRVLEEANAYRAQVVAEAEGEAQRFEKLLVEYEKAPEITRERLYLDAMENVMTSTSKVMVNVEGGNNMFYIPLDRMVGRQSSSLDLPTLSPEAASRVAEQVRSGARVAPTMRGGAR